MSPRTPCAHVHSIRVTTNRACTQPCPSLSTGPHHKRRLGFKSSLINKTAKGRRQFHVTVWSLGRGTVKSVQVAPASTARPAGTHSACKQNRNRTWRPWQDRTPEPRPPPTEHGQRGRGLGCSRLGAGAGAAAGRGSPAPDTAGRRGPTPTGGRGGGGAKVRLFLKCRDGRALGNSEVYGSVPAARRSSSSCHCPGARQPRQAGGDGAALGRGCWCLWCSHPWAA